MDGIRRAVGCAQCPVVSRIVLERHRVEFRRDACCEITPGCGFECSPVFDAYTFTRKQVSLEVITVHVNQSRKDDMPVRVQGLVYCRLFYFGHGGDLAIRQDNGSVQNARGSDDPVTFDSD
jgi:hypothetical protein